MSIQEKIQEILLKEFSPQILKIEDESDAHFGHSEALKSGGGHFKIVIVSESFQDLKPIERHRLIYQALDKELKKEIHAMAIRAFSPSEFEKEKS